MRPMDVDQDISLLRRITIVPGVFGGKPVIRGRRLAVEHVLGMLAAGDDEETILAGYSWLEPEDIRACLMFNERNQHVQDFEEGREWESDVEDSCDAPQYEGASDIRAATLQTDEVELEWSEDLEWSEEVEPDYDSEEERMRTEGEPVGYP